MPMWITERKLQEFIRSEMQTYLQQSGASLESAIAALKDCFTVDNNGNINVTNSNFELYIGSTVTKTSDERQLTEIKDLVSGLYGVLAEKSAEELRRFGFLEEAAERTDAALKQLRTDLKKNAERTAEELEQLRADLLDGVHSVLEYQERAEKDRQKALTDAFTEQKREMLLNARANLYGIMNEIWAGRYDQTYPERICHWSNEIKRQLPEDFIADFCLTVFAPSENVALESRFLSGKCAGRTEEERAFVLRTMLHRLRQKRLMLPINVWLEDYKNACADQNDPVYLSFKKAYDVRKQELDDGVYQVSKPRKVFVAFSRKDIDVVLPMVDELEERNITCFVSTRNMLQENGDHYEEDLKKAIEACDVFLLVSTRNSRADDCDAYRIEMMKLLYDNELKAYRRTHGRNCRYEEIPASFKKKRLEYLVEAYRTPMTYEEEDVKKLIFYGQDPCNKDTLTSAIRAKLLEVLSDDEPVLAPVVSAPAPTTEPSTPAEPQASAVKYCVKCLKECDEADEFCSECGGDRFRPTRDAKYCVGCDTENGKNAKFCRKCRGTLFAETPEEAAEQRQKLAEEAEERRKVEEEAKRKAEAEAKRKAEEEAKRKAEEEAKRKAIATDLREKGTFGSYPQTRVTDNALVRRLNKAAGKLPTAENAAAWTSYEYYVENKNDRDFMWYIDLEDAGEKYRGVYFTSYRPFYTTFSSSAIYSYQYNNGYTTGNVYWFRYEPIKWRILSESNGEALILCEMIIDSQEYCHYTTTSQFEHNGGAGYLNNYALSNIRKWLNDTFYNTAFSDVQKQIILLTTVDNSERSTNPNNDATAFNGGTNQYACENTEDYVFLLSEQEVTNSAYGFDSSWSNHDTVRQKKNTDYAKSQGVGTSASLDDAGNGYWWLRSPYHNLSGLALRVSFGGKYAYDIVDDTDGGVVPALKIKLS